MGRLLLVDALGMNFRTAQAAQEPRLPGLRHPPHRSTALIDYDQFCGITPPSGNGPLEVSSHGFTPQGAPEIEGIPQFSVEQLKSRLDTGDRPFILDVREPHEYAIVNLGAPLIPAGQIGGRLSELPQDKATEIVVHCKTGGRSQKAAQELKANGYTYVSNLAGGIAAWAERIDTSLPKY